jgi:DNA-binding phage protein
MRQLEIEDVISLLRAEVKRAGGPAAWSRETGIHRTTISKVLCGLQAPTKGIISALGLRTIIVSE